MSGEGLTIRHRSREKELLQSEKVYFYVHKAPFQAPLWQHWIWNGGVKSHLAAAGTGWYKENNEGGI